MKIPDEHARKIVWEALFKHDGDRAKAAKELGISLRTLYRRLDQLGLYEHVDKMGWTEHKGPPRKLPRGANTTKERILAMIRADGHLSYKDLCVELFAADTPDARKTLYGVLDDLKAQRLIVQGKDDTWYVVEVRKKAVSGTNE